MMSTTLWVNVCDYTSWITGHISRYPLFITLVLWLAPFLLEHWCQKPCSFAMIPLFLGLRLPHPTSPFLSAVRLLHRPLPLSFLFWSRVWWFVFPAPVFYFNLHFSICISQSCSEHLPQCFSVSVCLPWCVKHLYKGCFDVYLRSRHLCQSWSWFLLTAFLHVNWGCPQFSTG